MRHSIRLRVSELVACGAILAFAVAALVIALDYDFGSIRRMGPGFFPVMTCVVIVLLAIATAVETLLLPTRPREASWRPVIFIALAVVAWTQLIDRAGLVPATVAMIFVASLAKPPFRPVALLVLSTGICVAGYLIFIEGLRMPLTLLGR